LTARGTLLLGGEQGRSGGGAGEKKGLWTSYTPTPSLIATRWLVLSGLVLVALGSRTLATAQDSTLEAVKTRGVLRAGIRFDNPPHSFIDRHGRRVGFDVDIADAVARVLGVKLHKVKVDQLTRISYLKSGKIDMAVASLSHTYKRDQEIDFSQT
jgi:polar amino acid transport system substrate-binding protein